MSLASREAESVHLEYRSRPHERMLDTLLFSRQYRVLASLGVGLCLVSLIAGMPDWSLPLLALGLALLLGFVWMPFATRLHSPQITLTATNAGLDLDVGGVRGQMTWTSVRRARRTAGVFALEMEPAGTIPIPLRVFGDDELSQLEELLATGRRSRALEDAMSQAAGDNVLFTVQHAARLRDAALAMAIRPINVVPVLLGAVLLVVGATALMTPPTELIPTEWAGPLVAIGFVLVVAPLWVFPLRVYMGGGRSTITAPGELEIGAGGYRARCGPIDSWTAWSSFASVRRVGPVFVFGVKGSNAEVCISTRGFTPVQIDTFRAVLREHGLDPG